MLSIAIFSTSSDGSQHAIQTSLDVIREGGEALVDLGMQQHHDRYFADEEFSHTLEPPRKSRMICSWTWTKSCIQPDFAARNTILRALTTIPQYRPSFLSHQHFLSPLPPTPTPTPTMTSYQHSQQFQCGGQKPAVSTVIEAMVMHRTHLHNVV